VDCNVVPVAFCDRRAFVPATVLLLCFMMGPQNAVISKLSNAEIRTTHVTGIVTDIGIGIELGKLFYWNRRHPVVEQRLMLANRDRLKVLGTLALSFFGGGVLGALGFKYAGYSVTIPLARVLVLLARRPGHRRSARVSKSLLGQVVPGTASAQTSPMSRAVTPSKTCRSWLADKP